jgi:RND family efflux transporter MFP subunit
MLLFAAAPSLSAAQGGPASASAPGLTAAPSVVATPAPSAGARGMAAHLCLIEPAQRLELRSSVEGRIESITVDRGSEVRKGQVLVELDSAAERAALEAARYRAVMEGQLRTAESRRKAAEVKLQRRDELVLDKFVSAQDRDDSAAELQLAEAGIVEAQDNRRLAELEQRRLQETIEQRRIRSPVNGIVVDRLQHAGEIAQTGETARAVLRLAQINPLRVEVVLPVAMFGRVRSGATARVNTEAPLSGNYTATVTVVDRIVDAASGTFRVRLELPNPKGDVPAGVKCTVQF